MSPCGFAMIWMSAWDYAMMWMSIWCKCPLMGMSWMRMLACTYVMNVNAHLGMPWCHDANVPMVHAMMRMSAWEYAIMRVSHWCMPWCKCFLRVCYECKCLFGSMPWYECFDANTVYSKIPFIFKMRLPQHLKPKCSQSLIYYSWKVIFFLT